jgi:hypothetical protein
MPQAVVRATRRGSHSIGRPHPGYLPGSEVRVTQAICRCSGRPQRLQALSITLWLSSTGGRGFGVVTPLTSDRTPRS